MSPDQDGNFLFPTARESCCDMYPDQDPAVKYPRRVFLATVWCLEDFLYRIGTQLADMANDALFMDLTVGQYAAQMKSINNCASKLIEAGSTNPKFNPFWLRYRGS